MRSNPQSIFHSFHSLPKSNLTTQNNFTVMIGRTLLPACFFAALLTTVSAQTPSGFAPAVAQNLKVTYAANDITPPGKPIARPGIQQSAFLTQIKTDI
jgi:hypothetical protein